MSGRRVYRVGAYVAVAAEDEGAAQATGLELLREALAGRGDAVSFAELVGDVDAVLVGGGSNELIYLRHLLMDQIERANRMHRRAQAAERALPVAAPQPHGEVIFLMVRGETGGLDVEVLRAGESRPLPPRLDLMDHSPTGFEMGYAGSGPAQLALAILAEAVGDDLALAHHQAFKDDVIARLIGREAELRASQIAAWFNARPRNRWARGWADGADVAEARFHWLVRQQQPGGAITAACGARLPFGEVPITRRRVPPTRACEACVREWAGRGLQMASL